MESDKLEPFDIFSFSFISSLLTYYLFIPTSFVSIAAYLLYQVFHSLQLKNLMVQIRHLMVQIRHLITASFRKYRSAFG